MPRDGERGREVAVVSDDLPEDGGGIGLDVHGPRRDVLERAPARRDGERALDAGAELLLVPGLEDVLVRVSEIDGREEAGRVSVGGDDDAHDVGPPPRGLGQQVDAAHPRHALVAEEHGDRRLREDGERLFSAARGDDLELLLELQSEELEVLRLVIDVQHDPRPLLSALHLSLVRHGGRGAQPARSRAARPGQGQGTGRGCRQGALGGTMPS